MIDEIPVTFKASAAIPRMYRNKFGRDIYRDMRILEKSVDEGNEEASNLDTFSLELFENLAWLLAYASDPQTVADNPDDWLEQFNTFSIYQVLPEIIDLWGMNVKTDVESKKKVHRTEREMTTPLFLLRCVQLGISIRDLDLLTIGTVNDMFSESLNDSIKYRIVAGQEQFDAF